MPTIHDMGIAAAFQPTPNLLNDPSILLSALALRERKRQARTDEEYRERQATEQRRQFDEGMKIDRANLGLRRKEFNQRSKVIDAQMEDRTRRIDQEAAAQGMFADLMEEVGGFRKQGPDGAEFSIPGIREKFLGMSPDDQQRAIALHMEERNRQELQAKAGKFSERLKNAIDAKYITPEAGELAMAAVEADPESIDQQAAILQKSIEENAGKQAKLAQRTTQLETFNAILPTLKLSPERGAAFTSMLATDPDATYEDVLFRALTESKQAEDDRLAGEQIRKNAENLLTVHPGATPEAARAAAELRGAGVPIGVGEANLTGETRQQISEGAKATMEAARKRFESLSEGKASLGQRRKALRDYAEAFEAATGQPLPGADDLAPDDEEMDKALKQAKRKLGKGASEDEILAEAERIIYEAK